MKKTILIIASLALAACGTDLSRYGSAQASQAEQCPQFNVPAGSILAAAFVSCNHLSGCHVEGGDGWLFTGQVATTEQNQVAEVYLNPGELEAVDHDPIIVEPPVSVALCGSGRIDGSLPAVLVTVTDDSLTQTMDLLSSDMAFTILVLKEGTNIFKQ